MNAAATSSFRGSRAISDVVERMSALANWHQAYKPDCNSLTLRRCDLDVLQRYPLAAASHDIHTIDGVTWWHGFELRPDKTRVRNDDPRP